MKELSVEEKAKRYDEALEKSKRLYEQGTITESLCYVFPELKESEDEKAIRDIKVVLESSATKFFKEEGKIPIWYDRAVAWLEKQGECHISHDDEIMIEQLTEYFTTGHGLQNTNETVVEWLNNVKERLEKQGEQKTAWSEEDEMFVHGLIRGLTAKRDIHGHTTFSSDCIDITETINWLISLKYRVQPKQEWSEEDETYLGLIITAIKLYYTDDKGKENPWREELLRWFKSLKERVQPQQEWSDEDYNEIETIACHLDNIDNEGMAEVLRNIRDKYYHIISQNAWKPSEGQLECLGYAIEKAEKDWSPLTNNRIYLTLKVLKEQLEKL